VLRRLLRGRWQRGQQQSGGKTGGGEQTGHEDSFQKARITDYSLPEFRHLPGIIPPRFRQHGRRSAGHSSLRRLDMALLSQR
jgi:hypothetical protein